MIDLGLFFSRIIYIPIIGRKNLIKIVSSNMIYFHQENYRNFEVNFLVDR